MRLVHQALSANYKDGALQPWITTDENSSEGPVSDFSVRYFTPTQYSHNAPEVPFSPLVDPYGHLAGAITPGLVHTASNEVEYYQYIPKDHRNRCVNPYYI